MQIGLDYIQMRNRAQYYGLRWAGISLLVVGALFIAGGVAYYGHLFWLRAGLDDYAAKRHGTIAIEEAVAADSGGGTSVSSVALPSGSYNQKVAELDFSPMPSSAAWPVGTQPPANRLAVPSLGIDVKLDELSVTGNSIANFASGDNPAAGYHTISANPGERGAMWLFGPAGKGAYSFGGLTQAPGILSEGEDVLMFVNADGQRYLYLATHTDVIPASEMRLSSTDRATIHLVLPVPSGVYDHFLVLSGELVGVK